MTGSFFLFKHTFFLNSFLHTGYTVYIKYIQSPDVYNWLAYRGLPGHSGTLRPSTGLPTFQYPGLPVYRATDFHFFGLPGYRATGLPAPLLLFVRFGLWFWGRVLCGAKFFLGGAASSLDPGP